jgi:DNA/RNA endonuclease YhcR with UshA esterase domain
MKLKYFIPSLVALVAVLFASCAKDNDPTYLNNIKVSESYVALSTSGGSTSIDISAVGSWSVSGAPDWLTVSPASGSGDGTITFSADAAEGRSASVSITCEGETQIINIIQGIVTISTATCAEVLAGPDSKTYQVTGTVTSISNTTYGNWYLNDGTGEVYIYGTLDKNGGTKNFTSWGLEVGDQITVQGPKTTYNGTVELVDVTVVKIVKSLIKVDSLTVGDVVTSTLPVEGGEITAHLTCKGTGVAVEIPADAKDWLGVTSSTVGATPTVTFYAKANEGGDRETTVTFKTTDGSKEYTSQTTITQKGAIVECSVADFLAAEVGNTQFRLTGVITKIAKAEYGNIYIKDYSGEAYVYGVGSKGDFQALGLKEGDVITLVGKRGEYKGSAQMTGGQYEAHKTVTAVTIDEFLAKEDNPNVYYMVSGTVDEIANESYGNLYLKDGDSRLYVYGTYPGWGATGDNRKGAIAANGIEVGDKLTVIGVKSTYKGTPQVNGGIYFSHQKPE